MVRGMVAGANGNFVFDKVPNGDYLILASYSGYDDFHSPLFSLNNKNSDLGDLLLQKSNVQLGAVTVSARKPLYEQKIDRLVVNVKNSITAAGGTALEVLERSPGVQVDRINNQLALSGKSGVVIMINGKITNIPVSAIVQMLEGMNASNIEKIELITTPPANYDAEGNAGFINIVLINNPDKGLSGSWSLTAGYGPKETATASVNFNYRKNKVNLYGDLSYFRIHFIQSGSNYRKVTNSSQQVKESQSQTTRDAVREIYNVRLGLDYQLGKKTVAGVLFNANDNNWEMEAKNEVSKFTNGVKDTMLSIPNEEINHWRFLTSNFNLQHTFSENELLTFDFNYAWYDNKNPTEYHNHYYDGSGNPLYSEQTRSGKTTPIHIWVANSDYKKKLGKKIDLEAGLKLAIFRFKNDVYVDAFQQNTWVPDPAFTALYTLKENIASAYTSMSVHFTENTSAKFGLRYEYTSTDLSAATQPKIVDRQYGKLFPTIYLSRKLDENNSINLAYNRRIGRPKISNLAPFLIFIDPSTFLSGNANLQASIADKLKADYVYKKFIFSLEYTYESNTIANFQTTVDVNTNKQTLQAQNLESTRMLSAVVSLPINITKWWTTYTNISANYQKVKVIQNKTPLELSVGDLFANMTHNFTLPKNYSCELTGYFQSASLWGTYATRPFGALNIGFQKKFKDNSTLRFNVSDIFKSEIYTMVADRPELNFYTKTVINFAMRQYRLTYTRSFGKKDLKDKRNRGTGSEEELNRVN